MKNVLNHEEIEAIKECGKILRDSLYEVREAVRDGITTKELDNIAESAIVARGGVPSFKDYEVKGVGSFPSSVCISVNDEVVHGIPGDLTIKEGDVVSLDLGVIYKGVCTDMAITVPVGKVSEEAKKLIRITRESLEKGITQAKVGNRIGDIGYEIQEYAEKNGFGVVRELVGHGIGREPHMEPHIPNFGQKGTGPLIEEGMALAIEPMLTHGSYDVTVGDDGWTVKTRDGSLAAHFEHTVVIVNGKPVIVTA